MIQTIQKYLLFAVTFPERDLRDSLPIYFSSEEDGMKCANLNLGWYDSKGGCYVKEFDNDLPPYYKSFEEWAKEKLSYDECKKLNII